MKNRTQQKGVALITVMMVVALASFSVATIVYNQQLDIRRTENTLYHGQAIQIASLIEQLAIEVLIIDANEDNNNNDQRDHFGEPWDQIKDFPIPFEDFIVEAEIIDLQGRFNLNNLAQSGTAGTDARNQFKRLLNTSQINVPYENTIADYIDTDTTPLPKDGAAEDDRYQSLEVAYLTANQNMVSPSELRLILGITKEEYETLLPFITALPVTTKININTASAEVLTTVANNISLNALEGLINKRNSKPFEDVAELTGDPIFAGKQLDANLLSVSSEYFLLKATVFYGHIQLKHQVIFERQGTTVRSIMRAEGEI